MFRLSLAIYLHHVFGLEHSKIGGSSYAFVHFAHPSELDSLFIFTSSGLLCLLVSWNVRKHFAVCNAFLGGLLVGGFGVLVPPIVAERCGICLFPFVF